MVPKLLPFGSHVIVAVEGKDIISMWTLFAQRIQRGLRRAHCIQNPAEKMPSACHHSAQQIGLSTEDFPRKFLSR